MVMVVENWVVCLLSLFRMDLGNHLVVSVVDDWVVCPLSLFSMDIGNP